MTAINNPHLDHLCTGSDLGWLKIQMNALNYSSNTLQVKNVWTWTWINSYRSPVFVWVFIISLLLNIWNQNRPISGWILGLGFEDWMFDAMKYDFLIANYYHHREKWIQKRFNGKFWLFVCMYLFIIEALFYNFNFCRITSVAIP